MTETEKKQRVQISATYRKNREKRGDAQVNLWLPESLRERLDKVVKSGQFKNRSEAAIAAFDRLLENDKM